MRQRAGHRGGQCVAGAVVVSGVHPRRIELVKVVAVEPDDVREVLVRMIAELEAIGVEAPASLILAVLLLGITVDDDRRKP